MVTESYLIKRIEMLQEELESLKKSVAKNSTKKAKPIRGIWKGVDISDEQIEEAKASWLKV
jgi:hypothetical protein